MFLGVRINFKQRYSEGICDQELVHVLGLRKSDMRFVLHNLSHSVTLSSFYTRTWILNNLVLDLKVFSLTKL